MAVSTSVLITLHRNIIMPCSNTLAKNLNTKTKAVTSIVYSGAAIQTHSVWYNTVLGTETLNLNGVRREETSRMRGLPAMKAVTMSSWSSCRWKRGAEEEGEEEEAEVRDMVGR